MVTVFTSITLNYLPKARILFESLKKYHPDWECIVVISDKIDARYNLESEINIETEPFDDILWFQDLDIPDFNNWVFKHSVVEISTAVKGPTLAKFAKEGKGKIIYLDPDIVVFNSLQQLVILLDEFGIILTPHLIYPQEDRSILDNEIFGTLIHGVFNLGFIAVNADTAEGYKFANWWADRLLNYCYDDKEKGLFTDQKWCDLVPCYFENYLVLRDPGYNVASWNLAKRKVSMSNDGMIMINDEFPLRFYHFTGYDSGAGHTMTKIYGEGNILLEEIWAWYSRQLEKFQQSEADKMSWAYDFFEDGTKIPRSARLLYRNNPQIQKKYSFPYDSTNKIWEKEMKIFRRRGK